MKHRLLTVAALLAAVSGVGAQGPAPLRLEVRPFAGRYVPMGSQADDFKSSTLFGVQTALELNSHVHFLGSLAWSNGRSKIGALTNDEANLWQYDAGAEFNGYQELGYGWLFRPFVGVGGGARTYEYAQTGIGSRTCASGYGALGTEFQKASVALRFESRGYVNCFKSPLTGENLNRSDATFGFGFAYHIF